MVSGGTVARETGDVPVPGDPQEGREGRASQRLPRAFLRPGPEAADTGEAREAGTRETPSAGANGHHARLRTEQTKRAVAVQRNSPAIDAFKLSERK